MATVAACRIVAALVKDFQAGTCAEPSTHQCFRRSRVFWISQQVAGPRQWDASVLARSESSQFRSVCGNSVSSSSAGSLSETRTFSRRNPRTNGNVLNQGEQRRRTIGVQVAAAREEDGEEPPPEAARKRRSLEQLDEQLKILQNRESSASERMTGDLRDQTSGADGRGPPLQWPEFSPGFFTFAGIGLMLLTIFNNVLYKVFLGPPVADRRMGFESSVPIRPRFSVTSLQQEREAEKARDAQREAMASQSREAPSSSQ